MWSKINPRMPISIKLTMLYTVILSCILLLISGLTVTGLLYVLFSQAHEDLRQSIINVTQYLEKADAIDSRLVKANLLSPGIILKIYDEQGSLVINSDVIDSKWNHYEDVSHKHDKYKFEEMKKEVLQLIDTKHQYFYETRKQISLNGKLFQLHVMKPMMEQSRFLKILIGNLFITNMIGIIIAIVSGIFLSNRILRPIRNITETAKEIEIKNLEKRIALFDSHDELYELANTFNHMLNRIQMGFEKQRRFVADASHELRTPITVINGYADMLDRWGKEDSAALQEGIDAIKSEAINMYGLIEKLLFLARADQNRQILKKSLFDTEGLIAEVFQETCIIASNHEIILSQNDPAMIWADPLSIKQMLRIFIENSINYTPNGGRIIIEARKSADYFEVSIQDTGIGISDEDQPHVFNRFYRVDKSRSKVTGGSGLGLSIANWIAEQHQSTIQMESKCGVGTTIMVRIPLGLSNKLEGMEPGRNC